MLHCKPSIVLIVCMVLIGYGEKAQPQPAAESRAQSATGPEGTVNENQTETPAEVKDELERVLPPSADRKRKSEEVVAGAAFAEKLIWLLDHELNGRTLGWRPNDLLIGKFTDNINEFQLGALEAIRYTAVKLKETLTRFGDADAYDPHLIEAVNLLMNRADQFWFPSAESQYKSALKELQAFLSNLNERKSRFFYRTDNMASLMASYKDLLGNCHENLVKEREADGSRVSFFRADNYFYYSQGVAHVMHEILATVRVHFVEQLRTIDAVDLMDEIVADLGRAVECTPWVITNSDASGILANHRYNLASSISSALHNMSTMLAYR